MEIVPLLVGFIIAIVVLEVIKHLFLKKSAKIVLFLFVLLILFLGFSAAFKDVDPFKENSFIQTGAVVAVALKDAITDKVDTEEVLNSTVKSNKLFKK